MVYSYWHQCLLSAGLPDKISHSELRFPGYVSSVVICIAIWLSLKRLSPYNITITYTYIFYTITIYVYKDLHGKDISKSA